MEDTCCLSLIFARKDLDRFNHVLRDELWDGRFWDEDEETRAKVLKRYDKLYAKKDEIEKVFGEPMVWERKDDKRISIVKSLVKIGGLRDEELWPDIQDEMVNKMVRLEKAIGPYVHKL